MEFHYKILAVKALNFTQADKAVYTTFMAKKGKMQPDATTRGEHTSGKKRRSVFNELSPIQYQIFDANLFSVS